MPTRKFGPKPEDAFKQEKLRLLIKQGIDAIDRGDYTEVDNKDLDAYLDSLAEEGASSPVRGTATPRGSAGRRGRP